MKKYVKPEYSAERLDVNDVITSSARAKAVIEEVTGERGFYSAAAFDASGKTKYPW